ncbi:MAG: response regulator [Pleurocapsa sp.]
MILHEGNFVFGDAQIPNSHRLCKTLGHKINPDSINAALLVVQQRIDNSKSHQEWVDLLVKMNIFTWQDVKAFILNRIILNIEIFLAHPGNMEWQTIDNFDLFSGDSQKGFNWSDIEQKLKQRQEKWASLMPAILTMDVIPVVVAKKLPEINNSQVKQHLTSVVSGQKSLLDIAEQMGKDPYKIAKTYYEWQDKGWGYFEKEAIDSNRPIVLSVDDSPIVQVAIKRSLEKTCQVILTDEPTEALEILDSNPVKILLLDLTMPNIDGLEFCQKIRQIPKFKNLPIVMVTARDGLVNRAKGHLAGTNKYLTKRFKPEELREVVHQYID